MTTRDSSHVGAGFLSERRSRNYLWHPSGPILFEGLAYGRKVAGTLELFCKGKVVHLTGFSIPRAS